MRIMLLGATTLLTALLLVATVSATDTDSLRKEADECAINKATAHEIAEMARARGLSEDSDLIQAASAWWWSEHAKQKEIEGRINNEADEPVYTTQAQREEYPVACQVWDYLKGEMGLTDEAAAGILGNMMVECGGMTLDLDPELWYGQYYGLCQWSTHYDPAVAWSGTEFQLDYLRDTIAPILAEAGASYEKLKSMTSVTEAARYFCLWYERPGFCSQRRLDCAVAAYDYFVEG